MIPDGLTIVALDSRQRSPSRSSSVLRSFDVAFPPRLGRPRCRDDTPSLRRLVRSNVSRQLRRCCRSRRRFNDRHHLHMPSKELCRCRPCRPPPNGRSTIEKLEKMLRSVQSIRCWATRTSDLFQRANVSVEPFVAALP